MPRTKNESAEVVRDLAARIARIVDAATREGREQAFARVRALVGGGAPARRGPGRPPKSATPKPRKKRRRNPWASMTPDQRRERVRKMLAGRGLKPKRRR